MNYSARLLFIASVFAFAPAVRSGADATEKSPSKDMVQWLGSKTSLETLAQFDYVGGGRTDLGRGVYENVPETEVQIRQLVTRRCLRAFLVRGGLEWERLGFSSPGGALEPHQLQVVDGYLATDFRFSRKDMIRVQLRPGVYSDFSEFDPSNVNVPFVMAYSRMVSRSFQWAVGASLNPWRRPRWLGGGGFRWQMSDRWKLQAMMPDPRIEYRARDDLHVFVGGEFLGESYRTSDHFGSDRGNPQLNHALVDFEEIRVGPGFSWNWKPLLEINLNTGYMVYRSFDFHQGGPLLTSHPAPFVSLNIQALFEVSTHQEDELGTRSPNFQFPMLKALRN